MSAESETLTPEDLDLLQQRLVDSMDDTGCMPLDVAHGFFTATATSADGGVPALVEHVLGGLAGDATLRPLVGRFRAQLLSDLAAGEYGPLVLQMPRDDGSVLPLPYGWCQGYMAGVEFMGEASRDALLADEEAAAHLAPLLSFLMYEESQWFVPPNETAHRETVGEIGDHVLALHRWRRQWAGK